MPIIDTKLKIIIINVEQIDIIAENGVIFEILKSPTHTSFVIDREIYFIELTLM